MAGVARPTGVRDQMGGVDCADIGIYGNGIWLDAVESVSLCYWRAGMADCGGLLERPRDHLDPCRGYGGFASWGNRVLTLLIWRVHGVPDQNLQRHDIERAKVRAGQTYLWRAIFLLGLQETAGTKAPLVAGFQSGKPKFRARRAEVISKVL